MRNNLSFLFTFFRFQIAFHENPKKKINSLNSPELVKAINEYVRDRSVVAFLKIDMEIPVKIYLEVTPVF